MRTDRILRMLCGILLFAGLATSCGKETKLTVYQLVCDTPEFTQPQAIMDADVQSAYLQFLTDLNGLNLNDTWQAWVVNDRFDAEDAKAIDQYDNLLPRLKALESTYKKKIGEFGARDDSAFYVKVVYRLSRYVPADNTTDRLREYAFELSYD